MPQRYACPGATNGRQGKIVNGESDFVSKDTDKEKNVICCEQFFIFNPQVRKGR
ncbi:MAG: hypothetical protein J6I46_05310 [Ruminococcus sp.]|nr:hypothetical protein [Ruminococcus sp.]